MNVWTKFPNITFDLHNVQIHESSQLGEDYLCSAEKISFTFDVFQLIFRQYVLKSLTIDKAIVNMVISENGENNFSIFNNNDSDSSKAVFDFSLQQVLLSEVTYRYFDKRNDLKMELFTGKLVNRIRKKGSSLSIHAQGLLKNNQLKIDDISFLSSQAIGLSTRFEYDLSSGLLHFDESRFELNGHLYLLNGDIKTSEEKYMDLMITSQNNNLQALIALLPGKWSAHLKGYRTRGNINFSGSVKGSFGEDISPAVNADFSCNNVTFYHPEYEKSFSEVSLTGSFSNGDLHTLRSSILELNHFSGKIDDHEIEGNLIIHDLKSLETELDLEGTLDFNSFLKTFPLQHVKMGSGIIQFNVHLIGSIRDLKGNKPSNIRSSGEIVLQDLDFRTAYTELPFTGINGSLFFNNLDMGIHDLHGFVGKSDVKITGMFNNVIPYILYKDRILHIEADLTSNYLDLNELLTLDFSRNPSEIKIDRKFHLGISPKLDIDFNCNIGQADLKRFHGEKIKGHLGIRNQIAVVEDVSMITMGGKLLLSGSIVAKHPVEREFMVDGVLKNIHIDNVFYVFNNFKQDFLIDENLKGQVDATINTYFRMDDNLHFYPESLNTYAEIQIKNGELIQFEPIQSLSKYMKNEDLSHLRFSDLQNAIQINDRTVFIPDMEITSNEYYINVSGTHTFDQLIDYHFRIPLDQFTGDDPDERFGEIDNRNTGSPNLFLKMTGTASDYKVNYDTKAVKEKIREDIKKEGDEIKNMFRKKENDNKNQPELEEDEYFDFDKN
jgi:hypothetical protein